MKADVSSASSCDVVLAANYVRQIVLAVELAQHDCYRYGLPGAWVEDSDGKKLAMPGPFKPSKVVIKTKHVSVATELGRTIAEFSNDTIQLAVKAALPYGFCLVTVGPDFQSDSAGSPITAWHVVKTPLKL